MLIFKIAFEPMALDSSFTLAVSPRILSFKNALLFFNESFLFMSPLFQIFRPETSEAAQNELYEQAASRIGERVSLQQVSVQF